MRQTTILFILFSLFSLLFNQIFIQNYNPYLWQGISASTSDNLDAIHINPAGLGVKRSKQFGIAIREIKGSNNVLSVM